MASPAFRSFGSAPAPSAPIGRATYEVRIFPEMRAPGS